MLGHVDPEYSQERKVQEALDRVGVSHNAGVVAHLANVQVGPAGIVYFCSSRLTMASVLTPGDGNILPGRVTLEGSWEFPTPGYYDLRNAHIEINGAISIRKEKETELVRVRQLDNRWEFMEEPISNTFANLLYRYSRGDADIFRQFPNTR